MAVEFRPSDWLATVREKPDFLGKRIREFQTFLGFKPPASWSTHSEVIWRISFDGQHIFTFSQTFPRATIAEYKRQDLLNMMAGDRPSRYLFRIKDYDRYVTTRFLDAMWEKGFEICARRPKRWARFLGKLGINYDVFQLPGYWLNKIIPGDRHINWLEMPGGVGVCSDKAAEVLDAGFHAEIGWSPLFPDPPNSEVTPADIWSEPLYEQVNPS